MFIFFVGILKATDEKSWIQIRKNLVRVRIRIRTQMSRIQNTAFPCKLRSPKTEKIQRITQSTNFDFR